MLAKNWGSSLALVATAIALTGCSTASFAQLNDAFAKTKQIATIAEAAPAPAAAAAAGIAMLAIARSLSDEVNGASDRRVADMSTRELAVVDADYKVDLRVVYAYGLDETGAVTATLSSITGTVQGYQTDARGGFAFHPGSLDQPDDLFSGSLSGALKYQDTTYALDQFEVASAYPLTGSNQALGNCVLQQRVGNVLESKLDATLSLKAGGKLVVDGSLVRDGKTTPFTHFNQVSRALMGL